MRWHRWGGIGVSVVLALGVLSGCASAKGEVGLGDVVTASGEPAVATATAQPDTTTPVPAGFERYYEADVTWTDCPDVTADAQCATVNAPLDWQDPDSDMISLKLARLPAQGKKQGSLLINPGGPGGSGVELLSSARFLFSNQLLDAYDVIGFDPRGVGGSTPVTCLQTTEEKDAFWDTNWPGTPEGYASSEQILQPFLEACAANTGALLGKVDTGSAARDMDMIRALVGDPKLNFLGYSYGTQLGAFYAELFPKNVGRMVLDGAMDPAITAAELEVQQAGGFQRALEAYVDDCLTEPDCPLQGPRDAALAQIHDFLKQVEATPLATDSGRTLSLTSALNGLFVTMYEDSAWFMLTDALREALREGNGTKLLDLNDLYQNRDETGYLDNSNEAFLAVSCLDRRAPADWPSVEAQAARIVEAAPTFGEFWAYSEKMCDLWPYPQVGGPHKITADGAAPILVIGTTGDPATPYAWSESLAAQLGATLLTYEGNGHTAYGRSNKCVTEAVDTYLTTGTLPPHNKTC
jgi:pimeloyl-ACP methyl ester carboxylesterase